MRMPEGPRPYQLPDPVILGEWDRVHTPGLEKALVELYAQLPQVSRAYVANIESRRPGGSIGLFVLTTTGEDSQVIDRTFEAYRHLYGTLDGLQLLFLHARLEQLVQQRCRPFFPAT